MRFSSRGMTRIRMPAISATSGDNVVMLTVNVGPRPETAAPAGRAPITSATNANTDTSPRRYLRMGTAEHCILPPPGWIGQRFHFGFPNTFRWMGSTDSGHAIKTRRFRTHRAREAHPRSPLERPRTAPFSNPLTPPVIKRPGDAGLPTSLGHTAEQSGTLQDRQAMTANAVLEGHASPPPLSDACEASVGGFGGWGVTLFS